MPRISYALDQTAQIWTLPWTAAAVTWGSAQITEPVYAAHVDQLLILGTAGVAGSFVNATFFPRDGWRARVRQGATSAITAMCIGGALGTLLSFVTKESFWSFVACGFIAGFGPKEVVSLIQGYFKKQTK